MHPTKNDLSPNVRRKLEAYLNQLLADALDLETQTKQAHWNVRGENFIALHELFDKVHGVVEEAVDQLAERVVQLGGQALGTARVAAKNSRLKEYPLDLTDGQKHVESLSTALAEFGSHIRHGIDDTDEMGDKVTADILTGIGGEIDKYLWFVEAHLPEATQAQMRKTR
jgi:starvation-inducible DNA-binding protein